VPNLLLPGIPEKHEVQDAKSHKGQGASDEEFAHDLTEEHRSPRRRAPGRSLDHLHAENLLSWCLPSGPDDQIPDQPADSQRDDCQQVIEEERSESPSRGAEANPLRQSADLVAELTTYAGTPGLPATWTRSGGERRDRNPRPVIRGLKRGQGAVPVLSAAVFA